MQGAFRIRPETELRGGLLVEHATLRAHQVASATPHLHRPAVPGAHRLADLFHCFEGGFALLRSRLRDHEPLALRAAQALDPDFARAVFQRAHPHDFCDAAAADRAGRRLAGEVALDDTRTDLLGRLDLQLWPLA